MLTDGELLLPCAKHNETPMPRTRPRMETRSSEGRIALQQRRAMIQGMCVHPGAVDIPLRVVLDFQGSMELELILLGPTSATAQGGMDWGNSLACFLHPITTHMLRSSMGCASRTSPPHRGFHGLESSQE